MEQFEVVVIGAGPAGGQCARELADRGRSVLLVEQHSTFEQNNFSSAATPLSTLETFQLPETVVGCYWSNLALVASQTAYEWISDASQGAVFDFAKLRQFLADSVQQAGGQVWMGHRFVGYDSQENGVVVTLRRSGNERVQIRAGVVIDATGSKRAVMRWGSSAPQGSQTYFRGIGTEYLIEVDEKSYERFARTLVFFLGYRWSPQGYSWIFPMGKGQLKVGTAIFEGTHRHIPSLRPLRHYLEAIIYDYMEVTDYQLRDVHGGVLDYAPQQGDCYFHGRILAIGDAVSAVNFLGGEGIRHGMVGARMAVPFIEQFLQGDRQSFGAYERAIKARFGADWQKTERLSQRVYLEFSDRKIDLGVTYLQSLSYGAVLDLLFNYQFDRIYGGLTPFLLKKVAQLRQRFRPWIANLRRLGFSAKGLPFNGGG